MNINVDNIVVGKGDNVVVLARPDGKPIALVSGDVVTADVLDIISSGLVMLRITPPAGKGEGSGVLLARTDVPLSEGDRIALKVLGGDKDISLKFMGIESSQSSISTSTPPSANAAASTPVPAAVTIEQRIQGLLTELAGARLTSTDFQALQKVLTNIPASVKDNYPEFKMLASLAANMEQLNEQSLRASVEGSGVLFETNMKQAAVAELNYAPDVVTAKNALNAVVQQAIEAFQYPQTEAHTRAFLSDLISVTSQGIQGMDSNNARDTLNQLKQAIADCISVVETEKSQHSSCNCSDVLAAVKQQLDSAGTPQPGVPKDGAAAAAQIPQRVIIDGSEVLIPQKLQQQQPGDAVTPQMATTKDGVAAAVPQ
ncbi:hypothetical protein, partial [Candidatus Magnetominusculus dajiuhuensis]|uniref:hypothetical protein n=1 Tax=Candidatus Magnetominusculus dajiuhuensis TaxID=3137712 RepID=UPI003B42EDF6